MSQFKLQIQLSYFMFVQYFIWGAWWVPLGTLLAKNGFDEIIGQVYATQGYAAILAPLFIGMIADRYFAAEKVMGVLHLCGAACLFYLSTLGPGTDPQHMVLAVLAYMIFYMPTLPLSTTIAFNASTDTTKQFPTIRVFGTLGWIVAGLGIGFARLEQTNIPILISAAASLAYGLYSFTLPHTPPAGRGKDKDDNPGGKDKDESQGGKDKDDNPGRGNRPYSDRALLALRKRPG